MLRRWAGRKMTAGAICLDPCLHKRLYKRFIQRIIRIKERNSLRCSAVVFHPLTSKIARVGIHLAKFKTCLLNHHLHHRIHTEAACILRCIPCHLHTRNILLRDRFDRNTHLLKCALAHIGVPAVETIGVDFVARVHIQFPPPLLLVEKRAEVVHPLSHGMAEFERRPLHQRQIRQCHVWGCCTGVAVKVKAYAEICLQQMADAVIYRPLVGAADHERFATHRQCDTVVLHIALRRQHMRLFFKGTNHTMRGRPADENLAAWHALCIMLRHNEQYCATDFLDIAAQLLRRVVLQPCSISAHHDRTACHTVLRNFHMIVSSLRMIAVSV